MVTFYYNTSNSSCRMAEQWFKDHQIKIKMKRIKNITKEELIHVLSLSESGLPDLLKKERYFGKEYVSQRDLLYDMNFDTAIDYLLNHKNMIASPIIFEESKLLVGFNSDDIRKFIPTLFRRQQWKSDI